MKWIVNFSGGWCSFWAAHRTVQRHGAENTVLLFADVLIEAPDLYRFNAEASRVLGVPLTRVSRELSPWQLFRQEGLIGNARSPICSTLLKREVLNRWMEDHYELDHRQANFLKEKAVVVMGFDPTEWHRVEALQAEHREWTLSAPMTEEPLWDKCRMRAEGVALGLAEPELYRLGFPHNNCGGRCVRAGISHFVHLLKHLPAAYAEWEEEEARTQAEFARRGIKSEYTVLRLRRQGRTTPLGLTELRQRVAAGETFARDDWGGCGCGGATG